MSTKKQTKKAAAPAKKPAPRPAPAKKAAPAKKPAPRPAEKKPVSGNGSAAKPVSRPAPQKKPAPAKKPASAKRPVQENPDPAVSESQNFAFSFAEEMKRAHRAEQEARERPGSDIKLSRRPDTRVKGKNTQKFPDSDLAQFKKSLLQLRQAAQGQSATLRDVALEQTEERGGEDEDGSDAFLRLQNLSRVDSQNRIVQKIDEALARIADGTYGVCDNCGQLIRKARLQNLPFVHTCMECQRVLEQG